jgi:predicted DNA-binding transcriptional regulator YafY
MSKHSTIRRFSLIIEKIGRNLYPSFEDIKQFMHDHGFELSNRTIQRDLEQIRNDFGIDILYDRHRNGYFIDNYAGTSMDKLLRFFEIANTAELIIESFREGSDATEYFDFESKGSLKGIELIRPLMFAIRNRRKITFNYERFTTGYRAKYEIMPYLLKEYMYRWYLVGMVGKINEFRTFGIDCMEDLTVLKKTFTFQKGKDPRILFANTIGLTYSQNVVSEVIVSFSPIQGKYVKALPLHDTQEIIVDNDKGLRIKVHIIPNLEFKQRIMMLGKEAKVMAPDWLAKEIKDDLEAALGRYK